jgi:hypothetical protein
MEKEVEKAKRAERAEKAARSHANNESEGQANSRPHVQLT